MIYLDLVRGRSVFVCQRHEHTRTDCIWRHIGSRNSNRNAVGSSSDTNLHTATPERDLIEIIFIELLHRHRVYHCFRCYPDCALCERFKMNQTFG